MFALYLYIMLKVLGQVNFTTKCSFHLNRFHGVSERRQPPVSVPHPLHRIEVDLVHAEALPHVDRLTVRPDCSRVRVVLENDFEKKCRDSEDCSSLTKVKNLTIHSISKYAHCF